MYFFVFTIRKKFTILLGTETNSGIMLEASVPLPSLNSKRGTTVQFPSRFGDPSTRPSESESESDAALAEFSSALAEFSSALALGTSLSEKV